ncbi:MAG: hypothetical protein U0931_28425 [Vulcanimicrobiota bacterium]
MDSLLETLGDDLGQLDLILESLGQLAVQLEEQLQSAGQQLTDLGQQIDQASQQARQNLAQTSLQLSAEAASLKAAGSQLKLQASQLSDQIDMGLPDNLKNVQSCLTLTTGRLEASLNGLRAAFAAAPPTWTALQNAGNGCQLSWQQQTQLLLTHLGQLDHDQQQAFPAAQTSARTLLEDLTALQNQLRLDSQQSVPNAAAPLQGFLKNDLCQGLDSRADELTRTVQQGFAEWIRQSESRWQLSLSQHSSLYAALSTFCQQTLPQLVAECFEQKAAPAVRNAQATILRIRAWLFRAGDFSDQLLQLLNPTKAVMDFFGQNQQGGGFASLGSDVLAQVAGLSPSPAPAAPPLNNPEPVQQGRRAEISFSLPAAGTSSFSGAAAPNSGPSSGLPSPGPSPGQSQGFSQSSGSGLSSGNPSGQNSQNSDDHSRELYEKMRGGQNTSKETLEQMRQETIQRAAGQKNPQAAGTGAGAAGGSSAAGGDSHQQSTSKSSQASASGSEEHKTIGGIEDNSREVYDKMRGGQNTPQETLDKLRQETIERAHQLEAARSAQHHPEAAGAGAAGGSSAAGGDSQPPTQHKTVEASASGSEEHKTIGGIEDNSREVYDKMRGGQNTSQETLDKLRQETIERAHQLEAARSAQHHPEAPGAGGSASGGSQTAPRVNLGAAQAQSQETATIGGFQDNSREVYQKMQGGENTPKETLASMRMETIERARRLAKEREQAGKPKQ